MSELQTIGLSGQPEGERDWHSDYDSAFLEHPSLHLPPLDEGADPFLGDFLSRLASNLSVSEVRLKEAIETTATELVGAIAAEDNR